LNLKEKDYLICKNPENPKKNFLVTVSSIKPKELDCLLERDRHLDEEEITIYPHHILLNLGQRPNPELKSVAGVDVRDVFRKTIEHDVWGPVHFLTKPSHDVLESLKKSLDKTGEKLTKLGFKKVFGKFSTEIRYHRGKYAGMFKYNDTPKKIHRIQLFLKDEHATQMNYVLYHEFGHAVRFLLLRDPRVHSSWISKFNTSVQVDPISHSEFSKCLKQFLKSDAEKCSEFYSSLEEDREKLVFKQALRFIQKIHRVGAKEINSLLNSQKQDTIEGLWPDKDIDVNELKPIVSDYACRNVEELFAESFAFHMTGKKLPKSIRALMEKSLSFAKNVSNKLEDVEEEEEE
jgi:hypothetical protein